MSKVDIKIVLNKFAGFVCNSNRCELDNRLGLCNIPKLTLLCLQNDH